jgi:60 kDa SS-A/Ro ribonucleoprotein
MGHPVSGLPISCREASAALAMVTAASEPNYFVAGFTADRGFGHGRWGLGSTALTPLSISPRQRLDDVLSTVARQDFGATDCSLPMTYARENNIQVDTFCVYTDNETWAGTEHPHQALRKYREATGIDARLVVVGMTATDFTIADPNDPGMLDVAGFDSAVPTLIADFSGRAI